MVGGKKSTAELIVYAALEKVEERSGRPALEVLEQAIKSVTAAVPTKPGDENPLPFALTLASASGVSIRMLSLVSAENVAEAANAQELRQIQVAAAKENLVVAARALPDAPDIDSLVADGTTLESALKKLNWDESDVLVVGSSRFAAPRRLFLGSTAARILAGTDAPVIVVPRGE